MLINEPRKKQPYLVNPANPWRKITVPKHRFAVWQDKKTHRFAKPPAWAIARAPKMWKKHHGKKAKTARKVSRKSHKGRKRVARRRLSSFKPADIKAMERQFIQLSSPKRKTRRKSQKGAKKIMKHRKSSRKSHRNPFNFKGAMRGFADTGMLIDGSLVVGGMIATTLAMDYASSKIAFLSTPIGKGLGKLGLAFLVKQGGKFAKINSRYTNMLALGVIVSAVKDVSEIILPKIGYTGGVKLLGLNSGYAGPQMLGSSGYSGPEIANAFSGGDDSYAYSD